MQPAASVGAVPFVNGSLKGSLEDAGLPEHPNSMPIYLGGLAEPISVHMVVL